jgi:hypothetical protein
MAIRFDNGSYTNTETGESLSKEDAYAATALNNTESVDERTEAKAVQSAERADKARDN